MGDGQAGALPRSLGDELRGGVIQSQVSQHGEFDVGERRLGGQFRQSAP